jgi:hypothetical protein
MAPVSAKDIAALENARKKAKKEYYKALLEQFCRHVRTSAELGFQESTVTVPTFLMGFPRYDLTTTVQYMCRQLERLGYIVYLIGPLSIKVKWKKSLELPEDLVEDALPSLINLKKTASRLQKTK